MSKVLAPTVLTLGVHADFKAAHSLEGFETPHFHLWKVEVEFKAAFPLKTDRLIDLIFLQNILDGIILPIEGKFLNETLALTPTSERMASWFWDKIQKALPDAPLHAVTIRLCDLQGVAMGWARLA